MISFPCLDSIDPDGPEGLTINELLSNEQLANLIVVSNKIGRDIIFVTEDALNKNEHGSAILIPVLFGGSSNSEYVDTIFSFGGPQYESRVVLKNRLEHPIFGAPKVISDKKLNLCGDILSIPFDFVKLFTFSRDGALYENLRPKLKELFDTIALQVEKLYSAGTIFNLSSSNTVAENLCKVVDNLTQQKLSQQVNVEQKLILARQNYLTALKEKQVLAITYGELTELFNSLTGELDSMLTMLDKDPLIDRVFVEEEAIIMRTVPIALPVGGLWYYIGAYLVRVPFNGSTTKVVIHSLCKNPKVHPHMSKEGTICWGNLETIVPTCIVNGQLYPACKAILNWLDSVNVDDSWGKDIMQFPSVQEENPAVKLYTKRHPEYVVS